MGKTITTKELAAKYGVKPDTACLYARTHGLAKEAAGPHIKIPGYVWTPADVDAFLHRRGPGWVKGRPRKPPASPAAPAAQSQ